MTTVTTTVKPLQLCVDALSIADPLDAFDLLMVGIEAYTRELSRDLDMDVLSAGRKSGWALGYQKGLRDGIVRGRAEPKPAPAKTADVFVERDKSTGAITALIERGADNSTQSAGSPGTIGARSSASSTSSRSNACGPGKLPSAPAPRPCTPP